MNYMHALAGSAKSKSLAPIHRRNGIHHKRAIGLVAGLALLFTSSATWSVPIGPGAFSGSETLINFDSLANGTVLTNQFAGNGIVFQNTSNVTNISTSFPGLGSSLPNVAFTLLNTGGFQEFLFSTSVRLFGLDLDGSVGQTFIMNTFDAGGFVETLVGANNAFLGVQSATDLTRIEVRSSTDGFNFIFDDVRFEGIAAGVPEPATLALLGLGLAGLGFRARKT